MENLEVDLTSNSKCSATERPDDPNAVVAKTVGEVKALPEIIRTLELRSRQPGVPISVFPTEEKPTFDLLATSIKSNADQTKPFHPDNSQTSGNTYFLRGLPKPNSNSEEGNEELVSDLNFYKRIPNGSYSCELCTEKRIENICKDKTRIVRHLLRAHTHCQTYECPCCQLTFDDHSDFENHKQEEHRNFEKFKAKYIQCDRCEHRSKNKNLLRLHLLRRHAAQYKYVCKCCAKCFKTWKIKHDHEKAIEQKKKGTAKKGYRREYVCEKCNKVLSPKSELVKHMKNVHVQDFKMNRLMYECAHCNKYFLTRKSLLKHLPICHKPLENDLTGYSCPNCDKRLSSKDHLKKHALVHSGERPHLCPECGQAFALLNTMKVHALSHYNIKPYACYICCLSYSQRSALMTHWKSKHKNLPAPEPVEIHQFFDHEGKVFIPCDYEQY
ncbi:zinc finger imprinted 3 [Nasonia vitripennis]|uniref:C2H2-type domain-containing protein n=1 Tax=Nasonia vitripennis TaxID=7425 RepID=A0A7M7HAZ2_NASVI|nr:zinc finger imprinted 3 [Nasonia vitripennis]XP_008206262.1 zinc finger imprinted 3 [Nasonia vitripennis]XP_016839091.1 zinc finger imprinted 3 [Nasonia vitripennis]